MWWPKSLVKWSFALLIATVLPACYQTSVSQEPAVTDAVSGVKTPLVHGLVSDTGEKEATIPRAWALAYFQKLRLDTLYKAAAFTSPTFLEGDFNGDHAVDIAFLVRNLRSQEKGILLLHQGKPQEYYLMGAGNEVNGMTDLNWVEIFEKIPKGETIAPTLIEEESGDIIGPDTLHAVKLQTEAINTHLAEECGGGIIYWKKNKYEWMHQE